MGPTWFARQLSYGPGAIAGSAQDGRFIEFENASGNDLPGGTIVGGQVEIEGYIGAANSPYVEYVLMILPESMLAAIPNVMSPSDLDIYQDFVWMRGLLTPNPVAAGHVFEKIKLHTKRHYPQGGGIVLVIINRDSVAWGATSRFVWLLDLYLIYD